jgi:alkylhydroperoxidase family enzyme
MDVPADPKYQVKQLDLERRLLEGPGQLDPAIRQAVADSDQIPSALTGYVEKVRRHAYKVTDEDVERLLAAGYSEDQIFELTVAAAYGAARIRLSAGLGAMRASTVSAATEGTDG